MTEQEQNEIIDQTFREQKEAKRSIACHEEKLDKIAEHLKEIAKNAERNPVALGYDMDGKDSSLRIGFRSVPHTDQDVHETLEELKDWKVKLHRLEVKIKDLGLE